MKNLFKSILIAFVSLSLTQVAFAKVPADKQPIVDKIKKERGGKLPGAKISKKVNEAFKLYEEEKLKEAIIVLEEIKTKDDFERAWVSRFLGTFYFMDEKYEKAMTSLKLARELDQLTYDQHAGVLRMLADLHLNQQMYKEAIQYYTEYLDFSYDEDAETYLRIANSNYELKNYEEVIAPARKAIALFEKPNENPYLLVMASYSDRKMFKEATATLEEVVKVFPEKGKWWAQLGMMYTFIEDYPRALSTLDVAYNKGYLTKKTQIKALAQLYQSFSIPFKAAQILEKEMNNGLFERDEKTLKLIASSYLKAKEFKEAASYFGEAAKLGKNADLYRSQGNAYVALEDYKQAIEAYKKAINLKEDKKGYLYLSLAESNFYLENWKAAHKAANAATKDKRTAKTAKGWLGYIKQTASRKGVYL